SLSCDVLLADPSAGGDTLLYTLDFSTVSVTSVGGSEGPALFTGTETGLGNFGATSNVFEALTAVVSLQSDTSVYLYGVNDAAAGTVPSNDLALLAGTYAASDFASSGGAVSGEQGLVELSFTSITISAPFAGAAMGANFCGGGINSTGAPAILSAVGSTVAGDNDVLFDVTQAPAGSVGILLASTTQGAGITVGSGELCLKGNIGRYVAPGQLRGIDPVGSSRLRIDTSMIPSATGMMSATAGDTLAFQFWYRDVQPSGQSTSNLTQGVQITFQ
ncbi:MAG: hypothetical protein AAGG01_24465, partial [Planctomycetota bacterium]